VGLLLSQHGDVATGSSVADKTSQNGAKPAQWSCLTGLHSSMVKDSWFHSSMVENKPAQ